MAEEDRKIVEELIVDYACKNCMDDVVAGNIAPPPPSTSFGWLKPGPNFTVCLLPNSAQVPLQSPFSA